MKNINRRQFLCYGATSFATVVSTGMGWPWMGKLWNPSEHDTIQGEIFRGDAPKILWKWSHEGFLYQKLSNRRVKCNICPKQCVLATGDRSICRSKINVRGTLYSITYGNPCVINVDPIEKMQLFHFKPASKALCLATTGCNFRCLNCQNWEISQAKPHEVRCYDLFPDDAIRFARNSKTDSIAYTYSEPIAFFEYMIHVSRLARTHGIYNVMISNGYVMEKSLLELCKVLDAANINLKAFDNKIYKELIGGTLKPVLSTLKTMRETGVHFEITHLVIPGYVDDEERVKQMCAWILEHLGPDYPLHFLRFFPRYKLNRLAPTPVSTLVLFRNLAIKMGIRYVYIGNVPGHEGAHTYCHHCGKLLIERQGYFITINHLSGSRCKFCKTIIPGVWNAESDSVSTAEEGIGRHQSRNFLRRYVI